MERAGPAALDDHELLGLVGIHIDAATLAAAAGRDQAALEIGRHLLASHGWQIEREKGIFGHGGRGAFVASGERRFDNEFLPDHNDLGHVRHHNIGKR